MIFFRTNACKVMCVFLLIPFFLVNKGLCLLFELRYFFTSKCALLFPNSLGERIVTGKEGVEGKGRGRGKEIGRWKDEPPLQNSVR